MSDFNRDRYKRPLIIPTDAEGTPLPEAKPLPYKRVSKLAKAHDDSFNLINWYQRTTTIGLIRRPDLTQKASAIVHTWDDPLNHQQARRELRKVVDEAHIAGGGTDASELGTLWHSYVEHYFKVGNLFGVTLDDFALMRINQLIATFIGHRIEVLDTEVPVVNDEHAAAGTFDFLLRLRDGRVIVGDLKTGSQDPKYPSGVCCQIRTYSTGKRYNVVTGERTPIHPDLDPDLGLLVHLPAKGEGCTLHGLNLPAADPILDLTHSLLEIRSLKPDAFLFADHVAL